MSTDAHRFPRSFWRFRRFRRSCCSPWAAAGGVLGGALCDPATAAVHWSDHGITVGDGVFETIKLAGGAAFALRRHLDRLEASAAGLALALPARALVEAAVAEVAAPWGPEPGRMRITVTGGPGRSARGGETWGRPSWSPPGRWP